MSKIKKIAILTSGGDCAGLNTAIGAVTKRAILKYGWEVLGIIEGTVGLMERPLEYIDLTTDMFGLDLTKKGGSFLGTINKGHPFHYPVPGGGTKDRSAEIIDGIKQLNIDALIGVGGDGSMKIIEKITSLGNIPFIGIPKTIDNDVAFSDYAIGFNTAVEEVTSCIERIHDTAMSHRRFMVVETMGRDVGHIALNSGVAGLADVILIPEIAYDIDIVVKKLQEAYKVKSYGIVVCSEAINDQQGNQSFKEIGKQENKLFTGAGDKLAQEITKRTNMTTRVSVLGHIQRGGSPSAFDRILASQFGVRAVDLLATGENAKVVILRNGSISEIDLNKIVNSDRPVDINGRLVQTAKGLGISFGD